MKQQKFKWSHLILNMDTGNISSTEGVKILRSTAAFSLMFNTFCAATSE